jgi:hypothetical protein
MRGPLGRPTRRTATFGVVLSLATVLSLFTLLLFDALSRDHVPSFGFMRRALGKQWSPRKLASIHSQLPSIRTPPMRVTRCPLRLLRDRQEVAI